MNIGVISDTHSNLIPPKVLEVFKKVDYIIHAGDFCDVSVVKTLQKIKDVKAVFGNMDPAPVRKLFSAKQLIACGKFTIGLYHGEGPRVKIIERVTQEFKKDKVDVVVFGHSHEAFNEKIGEVLYFNPGSPNDIVAPSCSYGILSVTDEGIVGEIIKL